MESDSAHHGGEATPSILDERPEAEGSGGVLESLIDGIEESGEGSFSVEDVMDTFAHRSVGALISVFAFLAALPLVGAIPGMSIVTATLILLVLAQSLFHRRGGIWVPRFIAKRKIGKKTFEKGSERVRPFLRRMDRRMRPRLKGLTYGRLPRLVMVVSIVVMTLTFYPLAIVPYGVTAPSFGVLALGLAMMSGDGLLALFGYMMMLATLATGVLVL